MPIFRINIVFANGKRYNGYSLVEGVELDNYYRHLFRFAQRTRIRIVSFDVVQISEFSREATYMRDNNIKRMSHRVPAMQPKQRTTSHSDGFAPLNKKLPLTAVQLCVFGRYVMLWLGVRASAPLLRQRNVVVLGEFLLKPAKLYSKSPDRCTA